MRDTQNKFAVRLKERIEEKGTDRNDKMTISKTIVRMKRKSKGKMNEKWEMNQKNISVASRRRGKSSKLLLRLSSKLSSVLLLLSSMLLSLLLLLLMLLLSVLLLSVLLSVLYLLLMLLMLLMFQLFRKSSVSWAKKLTVDSSSQKKTRSTASRTKRRGW